MPAPFSDRDFRAAHRAATALDGVCRDCPECSAHRRTAETLRVHRWIAHNVREATA